MQWFSLLFLVKLHSDLCNTQIEHKNAPVKKASIYCCCSVLNLIIPQAHVQNDKNIFLKLKSRVVVVFSIQNMD